MPLPPFNPSEKQDVKITIAPTNRAGEPTTGPFEWTVNAAGLTPQPTADGKTCLLVTDPGDLNVVATVTDTVSGNTDTYLVFRSAPPPPDNVTTAFNPSGELVDKATQ